MNKIDDFVVLFTTISGNGHGFAKNHMDGFFTVYGSQVFDVFAVSPEIGLDGHGKYPDTGPQGQFDSQAVEFLGNEMNMAGTLGENHDRIPGLKQF